VKFIDEFITALYLTIGSVFFWAKMLSLGEMGRREGDQD
jgi:hypothetical protein